jgi:7-keto-8-aminopelargonate synthetase-like enzyme
VTALGLKSVGDEGVPIVPVIAGDPHRAVRACEALLERRVWAQAIRPPTVAPGTERLRFALTAAHRPADVDEALAALDAVAPLLAAPVGEAR